MVLTALLLNQVEAKKISFCFTFVEKKHLGANELVIFHFHFQSAACILRSGQVYLGNKIAMFLHFPLTDNDSNGKKQQATVSKNTGSINII